MPEFPQQASSVQDPGLLRDRILPGFTLTELLARGGNRGLIVGQLAHATSGEGLLVCDTVAASTSTWAAAGVIPSKECRGAGVSASLRALDFSFDGEVENGAFNVLNNKWQPGFACRVESASFSSTLAGAGTGTIGIHINGSQTPRQTATSFVPVTGVGVYIELTTAVDVVAGEAIGVGTTFGGSIGDVLVTLYVRRLFT